MLVEFTDQRGRSGRRATLARTGLGEARRGGWHGSGGSTPWLPGDGEQRWPRRGRRSSVAWRSRSPQWSRMTTSLWRAARGGGFAGGAVVVRHGGALPSSSAWWRQRGWWWCGVVGPSLLPRRAYFYFYFFEKKVCRVFFGHSATSLPSARQKTLGKLAFVINRFAESRLSSVFGTSPSAPGTRQSSCIR